MQANGQVMQAVAGCAKRRQGRAQLLRDRRWRCCCDAAGDVAVDVAAVVGVVVAASTPENGVVDPVGAAVTVGAAEAGSSEPR